MEYKQNWVVNYYYFNNNDYLYFFWDHFKCFMIGGDRCYD